LIGIFKYNHCYVTLDSKKPNNTRGGEGGTKGVQGMISKGVLSGAKFASQSTENIRQKMCRGVRGRRGERHKWKGV